MLERAVYSDTIKFIIGQGQGKPVTIPWRNLTFVRFPARDLAISRNPSLLSRPKNPHSEAYRHLDHIESDPARNIQNFLPTSYFQPFPGVRLICLKNGSPFMKSKQ